MAGPNRVALSTEYAKVRTSRSAGSGAGDVCVRQRVLDAVSRQEDPSIPWSSTQPARAGGAGSIVTSRSMGAFGSPLSRRPLLTIRIWQRP